MTSLSKKLLALTVAVGALGGVVPTQAQETQPLHRWDLPGAYAATNFHSELLHVFAKDVEELSQGKLKISVHDSASLYKMAEIKRAVQGNQVQAGEILLSAFANEDPLYELDGLPFVTNSYESAWKLYQAQKPYLEKKLASQGMMLLYTVAWTSQGIYTNRELNTVADMRGLKWRAYNPATARIAELVGAHPVTIQAAELSQAMATGVIDSFMTSGTTGYDTKTFEYIKKFYNTEAALPKNAVIVNRRAFDALDAQTQQALLTAGQRAEERGWKLSQERSDWYLDALAKNGMAIINPSAQLMEGLSKIGESMFADWLKKAGADGQAINAAYRKP